jgi:hypothetical protein
MQEMKFDPGVAVRDSKAWRLFVTEYTNAHLDNEEEQQKAWNWFRVGYQARKVAELGAMYGTPHTQRTREKGAAPHWLRCEHAQPIDPYNPEVGSKRCLLAAGHGDKHEFAV